MRKIKKRRKINKTRKEKIIRRYKKHIIIAGILLLFIFTGIYASYYFNDNNSIIMIIDSKACGCVKKRCISLKEQISQFLKENLKNRMRFKVIEYRNKPLSEKIMNKYGMGMIPAVVIINKKGEAIYNSNFYNFNIEEFKNKIYELKGIKQ